MYKPVQKKSSSWTPASSQNKSKSLSKPGTFSVQPKPESKSSEQQEIPSYSTQAADALAANVMRSLETSQQSVEEGKDLDEMSEGVGAIQTKLTVGAPGDKYEQEADQVAAQVMSMSVTPDASPQVQRFGEEDNPVQRWSLAQSITPLVQRQVDEQVQMRELVQRAFQAGGNQASGDLEGRLNASKGGGNALAPEVRSFMEPRFGADFSSVRVHTGGEAVQMNRELGAQAFTHGSDVYFGEGKSPGNNELTAHELTHVVQQSHGGNFLQRLIRTPYPWRGVILPASGANIRSSANSSSPTNILGAIPQKQTVQVLSSSGNWLRVESRYRGSPLVGYIHHTLVDDATSSSMAASVGTTMVWRPSGRGSGTDFESWASAATETPFPAVSSTTVMNCWEAVLLSAYRAGAITWNWIHNLYASTPMRDWVAAMTRGTRQVYSIPGPNRTMPQRGDLVFFDGLAHVALATGNGSEVYTFWPPPNTPFTPGGTTDQVKVFTIEALVTWWTTNMPPQPTVEFAAPAW